MAQRSELAVQTFLFADLSGFTALTEVHGDEQAADLAGGFCAAVRRLLADHRAHEVKTIGDALMLRAGDAAAAIRLSLRIVHDVGAQHGFPLVRVGMHTGPAVERERDWFGATVNLAARVSAAAAGGRGAADRHHQGRSWPSRRRGAARARPLGVPQCRCAGPGLRGGPAGGAQLDRKSVV